jgi:hypothetical protein
MKRTIALFVVFIFLAVFAVSDTPIGKEVGEIVQGALATNEGVLGTPVAATKTAENTSVPTNTLSPTETPTPTRIPLEILMTLEGGELFLRIEEALAAEIVLYNQVHGTTLEFESIIHDFEDLEPGSVVIELLDENGYIIGFIPEDANWCILDCENAWAFVIADFSDMQLDPSLGLTQEEVYESSVLSSSWLGDLLGMLYYNPIAMKCFFWSTDPWGTDGRLEKRLILVDDIFVVDSSDLGVVYVNKTLDGCPHNDEK